MSQQVTHLVTKHAGGFISKTASLSSVVYYVVKQHTGNPPDSMALYMWVKAECWSSYPVSMGHSCYLL